MSKKAVNPNRIKESRGDVILNRIIAVLLVIITIVVAYPLYLVLIASFSDPTYISTGQVWIIPRGLNIEAYKILLDTKNIWIGYRNSLFYTVFGTLGAMVVTSAAAYACSKKTLPGRRFFNIYFLFTMYFSGGIIPTYMALKNFGMINTVWSLLLPGLLGPYNMIICRNYFENSIPETLYESAEMDGAGQIMTFIKFAIPLAKPVLAVSALNFALGFWNTYFNAMIYISDDNIQTLQVFIKRITAQATTGLDSGGVVGLKNEDVVNALRQQQLLKYAVVVVSTVPMIILYPFIQKYFVKGIMIGSVKE